MSKRVCLCFVGRAEKTKKLKLNFDDRDVSDALWTIPKLKVLLKN